MQNYFSYLILSVLGVIILISSSCSNASSTSIVSNQSSPSLQHIWTENQGKISTDDIMRLQNIIPFTLVFPKYLPEDIRIYPVWLTEENDADHPGAVIVTLEYNSRKSNYYQNIEIIESNGLNWGINEEMFTGYLDFSGVKVSEQINRSPFYSTTLPNQQYQYIYQWEVDGVSFSCSIDGYDQTESRKVIQSLIE
jgi:hypothetical protein